MPDLSLPSNSEQSRPRAPRRYARAGFRWLERALALFGALVLVGWLTIDVSVITSGSMTPTLMGTSAQNGDRVVTEKVSRWFRSPRRWEVITFINSAGEQRMKRVAGLPGEKVQMLADGKLRINGEPVELPTSLDHKYLRYGNLADGKAVPCDNGYYVLGDFLRDSDDSRFEGPVQPNQILGRAWLIIAPRARFGWVR